MQKANASSQGFLHSLHEFKNLGACQPKISSILMLIYINLYIREKKKDDRYLVVMDEHKRLDFKGLRDITGWKKPTFGDEEELEEYMGVYPGGVTAFGVINDVDNVITVVLGKDIVEADDDTMINLHPFRNTATTSIRKGDFMRYLEKTGNRIVEER